LQRLAFDFDRQRKRREQAIQQMLARQSETTAETIESGIDGVRQHDEGTPEDKADEHDAEQADDAANDKFSLDSDVEVGEQVLSTAPDSPSEAVDEELIADSPDVTLEHSSASQDAREQHDHAEDQVVATQDNESPTAPAEAPTLSPLPDRSRSEQVNTNFFL
jgi:hypothetical protein